jgi:hypothetical protein
VPSSGCGPKPAISTSPTSPTPTARSRASCGGRRATIGSARPPGADSGCGRRPRPPPPFPDRPLGPADRRARPSPP